MHRCLTSNFGFAPSAVFVLDNSRVVGHTSQLIRERIRIMSRAYCVLLCVLLAACGGGDVAQTATDEPAAPTPDTTDLGDQSANDAEPPAVESGGTGDEGASFGLSAQAANIALNEGSNVEFVIDVQRINGHRRAIDLRVELESSAAAPRASVALANTRIQAIPEEEAPADTEITGTAQLAIGRLPILPRTDTVVIVANDGDEELRLSVPLQVSPVAAPDVYLLIGQSNMEGASEEGAKDAGPGGPDEPVARIQQLNVLQNDPALWQPEDFTDETSNVVEPRFVVAEDPLHQPRDAFSDAKSGTQIGLGLSFAKTALANTSQTIMLVPAAWSATSFCAGADPALSWNAAPTDDPALGGTQLADRALTRLNLVLRDTGGILRGILWHQGESDSLNASCAASYGDNLQALVARLRSEARQDARGAAARGENSDVPFVLGTTSQGVDERGDFAFFSPSRTLVDGVHRTIADRVSRSGVVVADDLVPPAWPCGQGSCVHFGSAAYRELGVRFYNELSLVAR